MTHHQNLGPGNNLCIVYFLKSYNDLNTICHFFLKMIHIVIITFNFSIYKGHPINNFPYFIFEKTNYAGEVWRSDVLVAQIQSYCAASKLGGTNACPLVSCHLYLFFDSRKLNCHQWPPRVNLCYGEGYMRIQMVQFTIHERVWRCGWLTCWLPRQFSEISSWKPTTS